MKTLIVAAGVAALAMAAGAEAAPRGAGSVAAPPSQPIPYSQLDAYLKASPKERASRDWSAGASTAAGAMGANASTTGSDNMSAPTTATPGAAGVVNPATGMSDGGSAGVSGSTTTGATTSGTTTSGTTTSGTTSSTSGATGGDVSGSAGAAGSTTGGAVTQ